MINFLLSCFNINVIKKTVLPDGDADRIIAKLKFIDIKTKQRKAHFNLIQD